MEQEKKVGMDKKNLYLFVIGLAIAGLMICAYWFGAFYSCKPGTLQGWKCINPVNIGTCTYEGREYVPEKPDYFELLPNGSLNPQPIDGNWPCVEACTDPGRLLESGGQIYSYLNQSCYDACIG